MMYVLYDAAHGAFGRFMRADLKKTVNATGGEVPCGSFMWWKMMRISAR